MVSVMVAETVAGLREQNVYVQQYRSRDSVTAVCLPRILFYISFDVDLCHYWRDVYRVMGIAGRKSEK